jgi:Tfp pilus assembly protein PilN
MPLGLSGNPPSPWARAGCKANPQQLPKVMILRSLLLILTLALVGQLTWECRV